MTAVVQAGIDLTKIRDQFGQEQANLETNLKKAKDLSKMINEKIKKAVKETAEILEEATKKAKEKMEEVTGRVLGYKVC
jgi:F0F1-type ATP synthase membrane subunit b/b'